MGSPHAEPNLDHHLGVRELYDLRLYYRRASVDEDVLRTDYQTPRFFAPDYEAKATDTILDVGAHIGVFTALAAIKAPKGTVHAIEAASENFQILLKNVAANGLSNVRAHRIALSNRVGQVTLHHGIANWDHSLRVPFAGTEMVSWELVPSQTLQHFLTASGIGRVHYMKMNVEGAEYDILLKTPRAALRTICFMLVECHPEDNHRGEELVDWLRVCGFTVEVAWSRVDAGKGWITARLLC